jgi:large subunit ribosomal protein L21
MKKAVISTGGKQYLVKEGDVIEVELLKADKSVEFSPLLVIDGDEVKIGKPNLNTIKVVANILEPMVKADKVLSIRYEAKKRVKTIKGHRQQLTKIEIATIS